MLVRQAGSVADLEALAAADFTAVFTDVLQLDSDEARVTGTCAVAWQLTLSPAETSRRRVDDGEDDAELV